MDKKAYSRYLRSQEWAETKKRFMDSRVYVRCYICESRENLQVHHKAYRNLGNEDLKDLCLLCGDCHRRVHDFLGENTNPRVTLWNAAKTLAIQKGTVYRRKKRPKKRKKRRNWG